MNLILALPLLAPQGLSADENYEILQSVDRITPVVRIVQAVSPSVVFIETEYTKRYTSFLGDWYRTNNGAGTGVVIHPDGYIVTNYHVVRNAQKIHVSFEMKPQGYPAELISFVQSEDLALLKIDAGDEVLEAVRMGTSSDLLPGERVVAIGNPYGQTHTVSTGIISGLHRGVSIPDHQLEFQDLIQTDASINFGNSGGPLLNINGEMIGINTAMNQQAENIGFAIPVDRVREVLTDILFPQARKSWLGFELSPDDRLVVDSVVPGSPAALAGICEGDRIVQLGERAISSQDEYLHASLELEPHRPVAVAFQRGRRRDRATFESWDRVDGLLFQRLGMTLREQALGRGTWLFVDRLSDGGPADELGLRKGDLIPAVRPRVGLRPKSWRIPNRATLAQIVGQLEPGVEVDLDVYRDLNGDNDYSDNELHQGTLRLR